MRYTYCLILILFSVNIILLGQDTNPIIGRYRTVDSLLNAEFDNRPGIVVLASVDGEVVFKNSYGLANVEKSINLSTNMIFEIGSMTKQFTSAAVLQLIESGLVELDDPIQKYVPYFPQKEYAITIHHLLSQTSGIPEFFDVDDDEFHILNTEHTPVELISYYKGLPLNFEPGSKFEYSNSNYPLLGAVIEEVSNLPLSEYFEREIFDPIGLNNTSLWYKSTSNYDELVPQGYRRNSRNDLVESPPVDGSTVYAAGGILSTLDDLHKWNQELSNPKYLSKKITKRLTKENKTTSNTRTGYGYGFFIEDFEGYRSIQHGGNMYGFTSTGMYLPKADIFVCVLSNVAFENTKNIARYISGTILGKQTPYYRQLDVEQATQYFGRYILYDKDFKKEAEVKLYEGQLLLHFPQQKNNDVVLYSIGEDTFVSPSVDIIIKFKRDEAGEINHFVGVQGEEYLFRKIK